MRKHNIISLAILPSIYILIQFLININIIDSYLQLNIIVIGINIILAVSLNLITGFTGQFSLGHAAFMSIGAYTSAIMTAKFGQPFTISVLISGTTAALAGVLIGIPTLRLKGDYLAIATLGFGEIVRILALNIDYIGGAIMPDVAIVFEGCPADDTCVAGYEVQTAIKRGPMLRHIDGKMITNPRFQRFALDLCEEHNIPVQEAVRRTGATNGAAIHLSGKGVPTIVIGIPVRYAHTHYGISSFSDYQNGVKLASEILKRLDEIIIKRF